MPKKLTFWLSWSGHYCNIIAIKERISSNSLNIQLSKKSSVEEKSYLALVSTNYVLCSPSWKNKTKQNKPPSGITKTKKRIGFERGRCLPHLLPHCGNDHDKRISGQGICRNCSPVTTAVRLLVAKPHMAKMLHYHLHLTIHSLLPVLLPWM